MNKVLLVMSVLGLQLTLGTTSFAFQAAKVGEAVRRGDKEGPRETTVMERATPAEIANAALEKAARESRGTKDGTLGRDAKTATTQTRGKIAFPASTTVPGALSAQDSNAERAKIEQILLKKFSGLADQQVLVQEAMVMWDEGIMQRTTESTYCLEQLSVGSAENFVRIGQGAEERINGSFDTSTTPEKISAAEGFVNNIMTRLGKTEAEARALGTELVSDCSYNKGLKPAIAAYFAQKGA